MTSIEKSQLRDSISQWLLEQNYFGIILIDRDLKIIDLNDWLLERLRIQKEKIINKSILNVFSEIKERRLDRYLFDALQGAHSLLSNRIHKYLIKVPIQNIPELNCEQHRVEISPLFRNDDVIGILIRIEDVTERVLSEIRLNNKIKELIEIEKNLKINEKKFHSLAENIPEIIIRINRDLTVEFVNKIIKEYTSYEPEYFIGRDLRELRIDEQVKNFLIENFKAAIEGKENSELIFNLKINNKTFYFHAKSVLEFNNKNEVESILILLKDITENELAKQKLADYTRQLENLNANKDRLFSIIAHDLRSPFNYLLNIVDLFEEDMDNLSRDELKKFTQEFKLTTQNIYRLLENLLTWSQLQRETIKIKPIEFNLKDAITNALILFEKMAAQKGITIKIEVNDKLKVKSDPDLFSIVIRNLVSNALKFTPSGGSKNYFGRKREWNLSISIRHRLRNS